MICCILKEFLHTYLFPPFLFFHPPRELEPGNQPVRMCWMPCLPNNTQSRLFAPLLATHMYASTLLLLLAWLGFDASTDTLQVGWYIYTYLPTFIHLSLTQTSELRRIQLEIARPTEFPGSQGRKRHEASFHCRETAPHTHPRVADVPKMPARSNATAMSTYAPESPVPGHLGGPLQGSCN
ncbi:hypothetical protein GGS23DRAFT_484033 [Durotheca rogersii]|uniref:uncharacterized protein n=1 Tax=Durotheca rogersii TaxID=419775 RepID=UPI00221F1A4C|nr:uncharacterized protein GGS23DRAFT_484033 [Durotheca rogersii]KAI5864132.1 hypothetical protein GGS23DRAFT_484033 [Durotheca rogersii]